MTSSNPPLLVVSSRTGNTRIIAHGVADELPGARLSSAAEAAREDLSGTSPIGLFFWCDRGMAPEDIQAVARRLEGRSVACFCTMGGDPASEKAQDWMRRTSEALVALGNDCTLAGTFLCQGRIDPKLFDAMTKMAGGTVSPEREARRRAADRHPDRMDVLRAVEAWKGFFG